LESELKELEIDSELKTVLVTGNQIVAEMVREALENEGIPALLKSAAGVHLRGMLPIRQDFFDFRIYVENKYAEKASAIVKTIVPSEEEI